jgi:hypothetical protein
MKNQVQGTQMEHVSNNFKSERSDTLKARVRAIAATAECKRVARNTAGGLRRVCLEVKKRRGGASRG